MGLLLSALDAVAFLKDCTSICIPSSFCLHRRTQHTSTCPHQNPQWGQKACNEYVNHIGTNASTPLTPMTPASDCPLLIHKEGGSPPATGPPILSPYENPYSSLGELRPIHLMSFAFQISRGMVSEQKWPMLYQWTSLIMTLYMHDYIIIHIAPARLM